MHRPLGVNHLGLFGRPGVSWDNDPGGRLGSVFEAKKHGLKRLKRGDIVYSIWIVVRKNMEDYGI